jgi:transposase
MMVARLLMDKSIKSGIIDPMAKRAFKLSEQQRIELIQAYDQATTPDVQRRVQAVRLYGEGRSVADIRDITGCSERSLRRWCVWYEQGGLERLENQRAGGNNAKLTPEQRAEVIARLKAYRPDQLFPAEVRISRGAFWTVSDVQIGLQQWYGVSWRSATSYRALLHESRLSIQQVESTYRSRPGELDVAEFETRLEKKVTDLLQAYPNLVILTMDQMSLYFQATLTRVWSPVGQTPVIRISPQRDQVHFYGALEVRLGREFAVTAPEETT